jgi:DNA-binding MarR family transcriptional regulator
MLRLDDIVRAKIDGNDKHLEPSSRQLMELARRIYEARRTRERIFDSKIFGEPAWDMLLALYCLPKRGQVLSVKSLTYAANVPGTTGLRCQSMLEEQGLIERGPPGRDCRLTFKKLTPVGRQLLERYLKRLYQSGGV